MTQTIEKQTLYDRDLNLWLETAIAQLRTGDLQNLDIENLIEELEGLAGRDRRELENRLQTLIEHILKRCYVNMPDCDRGWEVTIVTQQGRLLRLLKQSPSLKRVFIAGFDDVFEAARRVVKVEYKEVDFPDTWLFSRDIDSVLNNQFWD